MKKIFVLVAVLMLITATSIVYAQKGPKQKECVTIQSGELKNSEGEVITTNFDSWGYNYQAKIFNGYYCDAYKNATWCQPWKNDKLIMKWNDAWLSNVDCDKDEQLDRHYSFDSYKGSGAWLTNHMSGNYEGQEYNWDISGEWIISVNDGGFLHDYVFIMDSLINGTFTGHGGYPSNNLEYDIDEQIINGQIVGNDITFTAVYYINGEATGYSWIATGTIDENGEMSGTGTSGVLNWESISGVAKKVYETCYWTYFTKIVAAPNGAVLNETVWYTEDGTRIGNSIWGQFATIQEVSYDSCDPAWTYTLTEPRPGLGNW